MSTDLPRVLVTRKMPAAVTEALRRRCQVEEWPKDTPMRREQLLASLPGKVAALATIADKVDAEFLEAGPELRVVANFAVGYDNIDVPACTARGVLATNTPGVVTEATADLAWALLMAASRRIAEGDRFLRNRTPWIWAPEMMLGRNVHGKVLGIVGLGNIGQAVARRAAGFGMRVIYYDARRVDASVEQALSAEYRSFEDLLAEADFVTVHVTLNPQTRHLFGAEQFRRMKPTAVFVNASRGPVVDEAALAAALLNREIFAAGLDVFEREPQVHEDLLPLENVVIVPHLGTSTLDTRVAMGMLAVENILAVIDGRRPPTPLNSEVLKR